VGCCYKEPLVFIRSWKRGTETTWECYDYNMAASVICNVKPDQWQALDKDGHDITNELKAWMDGGNTSCHSSSMQP